MIISTNAEKSWGEDSIFIRDQNQKPKTKTSQLTMNRREFP